jgi:glycosyltransferase involved in cell wall biosynthesis
MKLVVTVPLAERLGGAENMLFTFLRHVDRHRIDPLVVFLERGSFEREVADLGIKTVVLQAGRLRHPWAAARAVVSLARIFRRERPALILNWMAKSQLYAAPAAMLAGIHDRVVWWQHGVSEGHWLDRLATLLPARAVGCSSDAAARAQRRLRPRRATVVVHPGVDNPGLRSGTAAEVRRRLSIPDQATVLGIVGRLQPWKGQHHFVRALAALRDRGRDVWGLVVGGNAYDLSPGYEEQIHRLAQRLGIDRWILFTGQVDDARPYIEAMDVLINASKPEPFGLVLVEAMALGVPVVAVDAGGPAEIIEPGRSGLLVSHDLPHSLVGALVRLVDDSDLRDRLAAGGRERYAAVFTGKRMTASLQDQLEALLA